MHVCVYICIKKHMKSTCINLQIKRLVLIRTGLWAIYGSVRLATARTWLCGWRLYPQVRYVVSEGHWSEVDHGKWAGGLAQTHCCVWQPNNHKDHLKLPTMCSFLKVRYFYPHFMDEENRGQATQGHIVSEQTFKPRSVWFQNSCFLGLITA